MKIRILLFCLTLGAVSGCGGAVSLGLGTGGAGIGLQLPLPSAKTEPAMPPSLIHFDTQGQISDAAVMGGFYRKVLSALPDGRFLVRDFYADGRPRGEAFVVEADSLGRFRQP